MIGLVVEGLTDRVAAGRILAAKDLEVDDRRIVITGGKRQFDARIEAVNRAARHGPWLALRDLDREESGCPVDLRTRVLPPATQSPALCLRVVVRSLDAWLLADREAFADHFSVPLGRVPVDPEEHPHPKDALTKCCRSSRNRAVRAAMVPSNAKASGPGPEYTSWISDYCRAAWRPDVAATAAPSLHRALREIDQLTGTCVW